MLKAEPTSLYALIDNKEDEMLERVVKIGQGGCTIWGVVCIVETLIPNLRFKALYVPQNQIVQI